MSEILSNIVVEQNNINFSPDTNNLNITPEAIQLNIYTAGGGGVGNSMPGQLLYNNNFVTDGVPTTSYANGNLSLGNVANVKIEGGTNGYVLQTDGLGNLTWTAQTGNGGGNGTPGGANTQIQYNDSGSFGGNAGFTFNEVTGNVNMPANLIVAGTIYGDANYALNAGNVLIANQPNITSVGTLTSLSVGGVSNLGPVSNVKISGGTNRQSVVTDGANNLSFATRADPAWANVASIDIGGIFIGKPYGPNSTVTYVGAGNTFTSNSTLVFNSFNYVLTTVTGNTANLNGIDGYMFAASASANTVGRSNRNDQGASWTNLSAPLQPFKAPEKGANNIVIFATNSNRAAFSNNLGNTWSNATLPNSGQWMDIAYGNGAFIVCTQQSFYNKVAISMDDGQTWGEANITGDTTNRIYRNVQYGNGVFIMNSLASPFTFFRSTNNGTTWSPISTPGPIDALTYGNGRFVAVRDNVRGAPYNTGASFFSTDNGTTWTQGNISNNRWYGVRYAEPYFVASALGSNAIAYSTDGNTWSYSTIPGQGGHVGWDSTNRILAFANATAPDGFVSIYQPTALYVDGSTGTGGPNLEVVPNGVYKNLGGVGGNTGAMWSRVS